MKKSQHTPYFELFDIVGRHEADVSSLVHDLPPVPLTLKMKELKFSKKCLFALYTTYR